MAFTQDDLDAITEALSTGELRVTLPDGKSIQYRSISELQRQKRMIEAELNPSTKARRRGVRVLTSKGVC
ncbi:MAG: phage head-tail joining protein [Pontibacterium sp.]